MKSRVWQLQCTEQILDRSRQIWMRNRSENLRIQPPRPRPHSSGNIVFKADFPLKFWDLSFKDVFLLCLIYIHYVAQHYLRLCIPSLLNFDIFTQFRPIYSFSTNFIKVMLQEMPSWAMSQYLKHLETLPVVAYDVSKTNSWKLNPLSLFCLKGSLAWIGWYFPFSYVALTTLGHLGGLETSNKVLETSLEMAKTVWKCHRSYRTTFQDLETSYGIVGAISKPFCTCFDISRCFEHWDVAQLGVSCNLDIM